MTNGYHTIPECRQRAIEDMATALEGTTINEIDYQKRVGLYPLSPAEQEYMDSLIAMCVNCCTWFKPDELDDFGLCIDCFEEDYYG